MKRGLFSFLRRPAAAVPALLLLAALLELFVFNYHFFVTKLVGAPVRTVAASHFHLTQGCTLDGGTVTVTGESASFSIDSIGVPVQSMRVLTDSGQLFTAAVTYTDDNFASKQQEAGEIDYLPGIAGSDTMHLQSGGKCRSVTLQFSNVTTAFGIKAVVFNSEPLLFNWARFSIVALLLLAFYEIRRRRLWERRLDFSSRRHRLLFALILMLGIYFAFLVFAGTGPYNMSFTVDSLDTLNNDCYKYITQAFANGQLSYTVQPSPGLAALSDVYDRSVRDASHIPYLWDSCYYHGKYYSYFGIAPVLLVLLPFHLLTGAYLPTSLAVFLFTIAALCAAAALYLQIVRTWYPQIRLLPFAAGEALVVSGANLCWGLARPQFYELAEISGLCFLLLGFSQLFAAYRASQRSALHGTQRPVTVYLALSGLFFGLMVASRPNLLIYMVTGVALLLPVLRADRDAKARIRHLLAVGLPLFAFAVLVGGYNALRFGSVLDFGEKYQLTVSNVSFNSLSMTDKLWDGLFSYFFQPLDVNLIFPFFHLASGKASQTAVYMFFMPMSGLFNFPALLILPACIYIVRRMERIERVRRWFTGLLLGCALVIALLDIFHAGVLMRYLMDIQITATFAALILWMETLGYFERKGAATPVAKFFCCVAALTVLISVLLCLVGEDNLIQQNQPYLYRTLANLFTFWR